MTNKLVYIKNGGGFDGHCGELICYSPIIYNEDDSLSIDDDIQITCTTWLRPEWCEKLNPNLKYLICKNGCYGYIHNNVETYFSIFLSKHIVEALKDLAFEQAIYPK